MGNGVTRGKMKVVVNVMVKYIVGCKKIEENSLVN